jgi:Trm5-related predicted tRNA methylase
MDLSTVKRELASVKMEKEKAEADFDISWGYYRRIVIRGAGVPDRVRLLSALLKRFSGTGVDMSKVMSELQTLKAVK